MPKRLVPPLAFPARLRHLLPAFTPTGLSWREACVAVDSRPEVCRALQRIFLRIHVVNTIAYDVITGFGFRQQLIAHAVDQDRMLTRTEVASEGNADCKSAQNGHSKLNSAVHEPLSV